jgi:uncharacterized protein (DUF305 family)
MNKNVIIASIIGLVIGVGATIGVSAIANNKSDTNTVSTDQSSMTMDDMNRKLVTLNGDDFDKAFIEMMIDHHQGAIDMAALASTRAKHDEIKILSQDIITAQNKEITEMQQWQMDWGYKIKGDSMPGMSH